MDDDFRRSLGNMEPRERIAAIRKNAGLTQQALADRVGVHWITISRLERGEIRVSKEWVSRIAEAVSVNESDIVQSEPHNQLFHIRGEIHKSGKVIRGNTSSCRPNHEMFTGAVSYISFSCNDFEPLIRRNDIAKITQVYSNQWPMLIGRMCLFRNKQDGTRIIGYLEIEVDRPNQHPHTWKDYYVRNTRSMAVQSENLEVEGVVTDIIYSFPDNNSMLTSRGYPST